MASRRDDNHIAAAEDLAERDPGATAPAVASDRDDTRERRDHIGKRLFASARLVEDALRGFLPAEMVGELDYATLTQHSPEIIGRGGAHRMPDVLWSADRPGGGRLLVLIELQTKSEARMAMRMAEETVLLYRNMPEPLRAPNGSLPSILPLVVYCGDKQWTAAEDMSGWSDADDPTAAAFLAGRRYVALDALALGREHPRMRNRMAVFARAHASESAEDVIRELREAFAWIGRDELDLRVALLDWVYATGERLNPTLAERRDLKQLELEAMMEEQDGMTALEASMRRWTAEWKEQGREEGRKRGRKEGIAVGHVQGLEQGMDHERGLLLRQAARRFGPNAGDRLAAHLAGVADPTRLEQVGDMIIDCTTGDELFASLNGQPRA